MHAANHRPPLACVRFFPHTDAPSLVKWNAHRTGPARPLVAATLSSRGGGGEGVTPRGDARLGLGLHKAVRPCDGAACAVSARLESDSSGSCIAGQSLSLCRGEHFCGARSSGAAVARRSVFEGTEHSAVTTRRRVHTLVTWTCRHAYVVCALHF